LLSKLIEIKAANPNASNIIVRERYDIFHSYPHESSIRRYWLYVLCQSLAFYPILFLQTIPVNVTLYALHIYWPTMTKAGLYYPLIPLTFLMSVAFSVGTGLQFFLIVLLKWTVIGRFKEGTYNLYGSYCFRYFPEFITF
jgi:hypothetical protein